MKYAATPRPSTLRAFASVECELTELALEGYRSVAQEELEDAHLQARIEHWERERIEDEVDQCYFAQEDWDWDDFDYEADRLAYEAEEAEFTHAYAVTHLMRTILRNPLLHA